MVRCRCLHGKLMNPGPDAAEPLSWAVRLDGWVQTEVIGGDNSCLFEEQERSSRRSADD
jgi:hypothetical protein